MFIIDLQKSPGVVRPLNGVNLGPIDRHYAYDYSEAYRRMRIPSVRTHDCNRLAMDVVDLHYLFPDPDADPDDPANYRFALTDDYLATIRNAGCEIYFRLGESIESRMTPRKMYVVSERWKPETLARVCVNIARHYNEGWAAGFEWKIRHWQFWNEPSNSWILPAEKRPCWTGTTEEFYRLYGAVAQAFKCHQPEWKIGLAGYGRPDFAFPPGHPLYREENPWRHIEEIARSGPIDSISWHQYGDSWENLVKSARMVRECLDVHGLAHAESHLTEWNYNPRVEGENGGYTWFNARQDRDYEKLDYFLERIGGVEGAAYVFGALSILQTAPLDLAHLYTGVSSGALGLFNVHGRPFQKVEAMELFGSFLGQRRVMMEGGIPDRITSLATTSDDGTLRIGIAHLRPEVKEVEIFLNASSLTLTQSRQFLESGWREVSVGVHREGGGIRLTVPLGGSGMTVMTASPASAQSG